MRGGGVDGKPSVDRLKEEFGGKDVNDVLALVPIIKSFKEVKKTKIGLWGISRGGMMSFLAATQSDKFGAIVADSAPVDVVAEAAATQRMDKVFETWIPDYHTKKAERLKERSVYHWHEKLNDIPILLLHGNKDWRVGPENTLRFALKLQQTKHPYELVMYQDGHHGLRKRATETTARAVAWFKRYL